MPLRVHLSHQPEGAEPMIIPDDEIAALQAQGLVVGEPEPVEDPAQPVLPVADKEN